MSEPTSGVSADRYLRLLVGIATEKENTRHIEFAQDYARPFFKSISDRIGLTVDDKHGVDVLHFIDALAAISVCQPQHEAIAVALSLVQSKSDKLGVNLHVATNGEDVPPSTVAHLQLVWLILAKIGQGAAAREKSGLSHRTTEEKAAYDELQATICSFSMAKFRYRFNIYSLAADESLTRNPSADKILLRCPKRVHVSNPTGSQTKGLAIAKHLPKFFALDKHILALYRIAKAPYFASLFHSTCNVDAVPGQKRTVTLDFAKDLRDALDSSRTTSTRLRSRATSTQLRSPKRLAEALLRDMTTANLAPLKNPQSIHCECALVSHLHRKQCAVNDAKKKAGSLPIHPYIGVSKLSCYGCQLFLDAYLFALKDQKTRFKPFFTRGSHNKLYAYWVSPVLKDDAIRGRTQGTLRSFAQARFGMYVRTYSYNNKQRRPRLGSDSKGPSGKYEPVTSQEESNGDEGCSGIDTATDH
ncbi:hypothetical protein BV25DRAFT_1920188 [Artomyces pyxidatus]|uniref:Uncharacterized protein n=1 Tax=Artomyces pyxidatus TaxID=48021 RepID=A0ACB8SL88_9AGAM|nr:hypothetical protein BV25DRAFT_1920188 [Artomyces pyxidatus]